MEGSWKLQALLQSAICNLQSAVSTSTEFSISSSLYYINGPLLPPIKIPPLLSPFFHSLFGAVLRMWQLGSRVPADSELITTSYVLSTPRFDVTIRHIIISLCLMV